MVNATLFAQTSARKLNAHSAAAGSSFFDFLAPPCKHNQTSLLYIILTFFLTFTLTTKGQGNEETFRYLCFALRSRLFGSRSFGSLIGSAFPQFPAIASVQILKNCLCCTQKMTNVYERGTTFIFVSY